MSQYNCTSLYQIDTRFWTLKSSERVGSPVTLHDIPHSELDKFCRSGFQWIPDYSYITSDDMINFFLAPRARTVRTFSSS